MILKLFNLNKSKLEQNLAFRQEINLKIKNIEDKIEKIQDSLIHTSVEKFGAIGDFKLLAMHKNTMQHEKSKLSKNKIYLENDLNKYDKIIIKYQKEIEKYKYLLNEEKKRKIVELMKLDEKNSNEYVQAQFSKNLKEIV